MKSKVFTLVIVLIMTHLHAFCQDRSQPETVIKTFIEKSQSLDFDGMTAQFACDQYMDGFDSRGVAILLGGFNLHSMILPKQYSFYRGMNKSYRLDRIVYEIRKYVFSLLLDHGDIQINVRAKTPKEVDELILKLDPTVLERVKLLYVNYPDELKQNKQFQAFYKRQAKRYGAVDKTERVALVELDGKTYAVPFTLLKYNSDWYLDSLACGILNIVSPTRMSEEDFLHNFTEK